MPQRESGLAIYFSLFFLLLFFLTFLLKPSMHRLGYLSVPFRLVKRYLYVELEKKNMLVQMT